MQLGRSPAFTKIMTERKEEGEESRSQGDIYPVNGRLDDDEAGSRRNTLRKIDNSSKEPISDLSLLIYDGLSDAKRQTCYWNLETKMLQALKKQLLLQIELCKELQGLTMMEILKSKQIEIRQKQDVIQNEIAAIKTDIQIMDQLANENGYWKIQDETEERKKTIYSENEKEITSFGKSISRSSSFLTRGTQKTLPNCLGLHGKKKLLLQRRDIIKQQIKLIQNNMVKRIDLITFENKTLSHQIIIVSKRIEKIKQKKENSDQSRHQNVSREKRDEPKIKGPRFKTSQGQRKRNKRSIFRVEKKIIPLIPTRGKETSRRGLSPPMFRCRSEYKFERWKTSIEEEKRLLGINSNMVQDSNNKECQYFTQKSWQHQLGKKNQHQRTKKIT